MNHGLVSSRRKVPVSSPEPKPFLRPSQEPPIQRAPGNLHPGVKQPGREADQSPLPSAKVHVECNRTSNPPYIFLACYGTNLSLFYLHPIVTSSPMNTNTFFSTTFSTTLKLCSSFTVRDQVSHPQKTTTKIIVPNFLIFVLLYSKQEHTIK